MDDLPAIYQPHYFTVDRSFQLACSPLELKTSLFSTMWSFLGSNQPLIYLSLKEHP